METIVKTKWSVDKAHSEIGFKVKHMMISSVRGQFNDFDVTVASDHENFKNAEIKFSAEVDSIDTNNQDRDKHLKSDDFFNAAEYPELKFESRSFDGEKLVGDLTIRDVTQEVVLDVDVNGIVVDPYGQTKAGFEIKGHLNRKDFGLSWSAVTEAGSIVVGDRVDLLVTVQLIQN
ncbi:MAG: YceI family protein [Bacteroidota bacterium]